MRKGNIVVVLGKIDGRVRVYDQTKLVYGTYIGKTYEGNVEVLLEDGTIYVGPPGTIALAEEQDGTQSTSLREEPTE